jgi:hypothetical protein
VSKLQRHRCPTFGTLRFRTRRGQTGRYIFIYIDICLPNSLSWGYAVAYRLRHHSTSRKIAGSRPDEVNYFFPCEGGLEYLHRSPTGRKRRRKGNPVPSAQCHAVPGGYKYGDLALQVGGVSRIGTIKYGLESRGTQTRARLRWRGPAATVNYRPVLSSERALQTRNCLKKISRRKKN